MRTETNINRVFKCDFHHPQLNFSSSENRHRQPEAELAKMFAHAYKRTFSQIHSGSKKNTTLFVREVPVSGSGIADLLVLNWADDSMSEKQIPTDVSITDMTIRAFEFKISNWRSGLMQAHRYKYFSHAAILVVPKKKLKTVMAHIDIFQTLRIGLWGFELESQTITRAFTPRPKQQQILKYKIRALELAASVIPS